MSATINRREVRHTTLEARVAAHRKPPPQNRSRQRDSLHSMRFPVEVALRLQPGLIAYLLSHCPSCKIVRLKMNSAISAGNPCLIRRIGKRGPDQCDAGCRSQARLDEGTTRCESYRSTKCIAAGPIA